MHLNPCERYPYPIRFLFENSIFLLIGAVVALVWINWDDAGRESYKKFVELDLGYQVFGFETPGHEGEHHEHSADEPAAPEPKERTTVEQVYYRLVSTHGCTLHFLFTDVLMGFFFLIAMKEARESMLKGGAFSTLRKAALPVLATLGGIVGPVAIYLGGAALTGQLNEAGRGWAIPCATDIAFSYLCARLIFGKHSAVQFLLILAIADDAAGLAILALAYPQGDLNLWWMLLVVAAVAMGFVFRRLRLSNFWWYLLLLGPPCWIAFKLAGLHAALGLTPIVACMPHADTDLGAFSPREGGRPDALNQMEYWLKNPVQIFLGLFSLVNAGVVFTLPGVVSGLVLAALLVGKPLGITGLVWVTQRWLQCSLPTGMTYRHVWVVGFVAGIGFTVSLFVTTAAFPDPGAIQDACKMGALGSFLAAGISYAMAKFLRIQPETLAVTAADEEPVDRAA